jgi:hypothetical protein
MIAGEALKRERKRQTNSFREILLAVFEEFSVESRVDSRVAHLHLIPLRAPGSSFTRHHSIPKVIWRHFGGLTRGPGHQRIFVGVTQDEKIFYSSAHYDIDVKSKFSDLVCFRFSFDSLFV